MNAFLDTLHRHATPMEQADCLPQLLGPRHDEVSSGRLPVSIYGKDITAKRIANLLHHHQIPISVFFDASALGGVYREGLLLITAAPDSAHAIKEQLIKAGWPLEQLHIPDFDHLRYYSIVSKLYWSPADLAQYGEALEATWRLLADEASQTLFIKRLALLTEGADYRAFKAFIANCAQLHSQPQDDYFTKPRHDEDDFYFNNGLCEPQQGEVFANVGALVGECAIAFAKRCQCLGITWKHIYNFEPDAANFQLLEKNMAALPNVTSLPFGLWSKAATLRFSNPGAPPIECPHIKPSGSPGAVDEEGNSEIAARSLDELQPDSKISVSVHPMAKKARFACLFCGGQEGHRTRFPGIIDDSGIIQRVQAVPPEQMQISFIKMDIEGAELEALQGARQTIQRNRPKLAISLYHKRNDIFEIPLYLRELNPSYRFYLRHHCSTFDETLLFAVP